MSGERNPPDLADLSAYLDGELSPEECAWVEAAIARDPDLAAEWAALEVTSAELRSLPTLTAPRSILEGVRAELEEERIAARPKVSSTFGSWAALFLVAVAALVFFRLDPATDHFSSSSVKNDVVDGETKEPRAAKRVAPGENAPGGEAPQSTSLIEKADRAGSLLESESSVGATDSAPKRGVGSDVDPDDLAGKKRDHEKGWGRADDARAVTLDDAPPPEEQTLRSRLAKGSEGAKPFRAPTGAVGEPESETLGLADGETGAVSPASRDEARPIPGAIAPSNESLDEVLLLFERSLGESAPRFELEIAESTRTPRTRQGESPTARARASGERRTPPAPGGKVEGAPEPELERGRSAPRKEITERSSADFEKQDLGAAREITLRVPVPVTTTAESLSALAQTIGIAVARAKNAPRSTELDLAREQLGVSDPESKDSSAVEPGAEGSGRSDSIAKRRPGSKKRGSRGSPSPPATLDDPLAGLPPALRRARPYSRPDAPELTIAAELAPTEILAALEAIERWRSSASLRFSEPAAGSAPTANAEDSDREDSGGGETPSEGPPEWILEGNETLIVALRAALAELGRPVANRGLTDGAESESGTRGGTAGATDARASFERSAGGDPPPPIRFRIILEAERAPAAGEKL